MEFIMLGWVMLIAGIFLMLPKIGLWVWVQRLTGRDRAGTIVWEIGLVTLSFGILILAGQF
ncbi:hypothetical protein AKJ64_02690 [candidate division MSBL1 archaeon SCGC-AAA259E17]|uniref:Uncharacterized protein n=1 Tax=candidate division MSBL1 archaeon SCGC-AAA259E17 TaxID=1698263 RepID=A0A133UEM4_9EURY|nr:hypothetical protein AKJ64_02690 [candidate division MSBL1 archaeon SCGC-AAA259E17]